MANPPNIDVNHVFDSVDATEQIEVLWNSTVSKKMLNYLSEVYQCALTVG